MNISKSTQKRGTRQQSNTGFCIMGVPILTYIASITEEVDTFALVCSDNTGEEDLSNDADHELNTSTEGIKGLQL